jgi:hypothetical protein
MKYAKINSQVNGNIRKGVLFATYSALIGESQGGGKYKSRYITYGRGFDPRSSQC